MPSPRAQRGRPRQFDEEAVLERAVEVFWSQGFDDTSLDDILDATGMARQSLYRTFGCKRDLFLRALEIYGRRRRDQLEALLTQSPSPLAGLLDLLDLWEDDACSADFVGCFNLNTLSEFAVKDDVEVCQRVLDNMKVLENAVRQALERAQALDEVTLRRTPQQVAHSFVGVAVALSHLGRCGVEPVWVRDITQGIRAELDP